MKTIAYITLFLFSLCSYAQPATGDLTVGLQQAIDLGLTNRYDIQANKYNLAIAGNTVASSKKEWVPDISGSGNMRYSPQIQATYIPGAFFGAGHESELIALGAKSTSIYGLDLNQTIFKPSISTDIRIAENNLEIEKRKMKLNENTIKEQIAQAYLNVMLKDLQRTIAKGDEQRYKEYAGVAEGKLKIGSLIENDYLKAKLDYENAKVETLKANQNYELALENMKYQINVPSNTRLSLSDSLSSASLLFEQMSATYDIGNRAEVEQLKLQQENNRLQLSKTHQNALPSVSVYANYSQQFLYTNFDYSLHQWWSPFSYFGLRFSVPITSNFKNHNRIQEYQIKSIQTDLNLKQKEADINYEVEKTSAELRNALQNMNIAKGNYALSQTIYQNQKEEYNIGALLYSNLLDTDRSLNTTEQNYIKSVYDFLVASINYQKAIGNF